MVSPLSFGNAQKMVTIFAKDAKGIITKDSQIPEKAAETFSQRVHEERVANAAKTGVPASAVGKIKHIFLSPEATIKDAKKVFDEMA